MRDAISQALKTAMKAQDKRRTSTLRLVTAAIRDRDLASQGAGKDRISDAEILDVLTKMVKQRREAMTTYTEAGRVDLAEQEREEIAIIEEFLPAQLGEAETRTEIKRLISELGAGSLKDMGRVMGVLKERFAGRMDFAKASAEVKKQLGSA